jgi:hypothetical protein
MKLSVLWIVLAQAPNLYINTEYCKVKAPNNRMTTTKEHNRSKTRYKMAKSHGYS